MILGCKHVQTLALKRQRSMATAQPEAWRNQWLPRYSMFIFPYPDIQAGPCRARCLIHVFAEPSRVEKTQGFGDTHFSLGTVDLRWLFTPFNKRHYPYEACGRFLTGRHTDGSNAGVLHSQLTHQHERLVKRSHLLYLLCCTGAVLRNVPSSHP